MAKQFNSINVYPLMSNQIKVVMDRSGSDIGNGTNKIVVRAKDGYVSNTDGVHGALNKDGGLPILSVESLDPLRIVVSGLSGALSGCDGLIASGSDLARGIVKSINETELELEGAAWVSKDNEFYLVGGIAGGTYQSGTWHSNNALTWAKTQITAPFSPRKNARIVGSGSDVWLVAGIDGGGTPVDIWKGTIDATNKRIDWQDTPLTSSSTILGWDVDNAAFNPYLREIYVGSGKINVDTAVETPTTFGDAFDKNGTMFFDPVRYVLWSSTDGTRTETVIDAFGNYFEQANTEPYVYTHRQDTHATTWIAEHNLGENFTTALLFTPDGAHLEPASLTVNDTHFTASFSSASIGYAHILSSSYYSHATSWAFTGSSNAFAWFAVTTDGGILEPASATNDSTILQLNFNSASAGRLITWYNPVGVDQPHSYRQIKTFGSTVGSTVQINQFSSSMAWIRDNSEGLVEPLSIGNSPAGTTFTFNALTSGSLFSYDFGGVNMNNLQDPWFGKTFVSLGYNLDGSQVMYTIADNEVYYSNDNGRHWYLNGTNGFSIGEPSPALVNGNVVGSTDISGEAQRSLDKGTSWINGEPFAQQTIEWYGQLGRDPDLTFNAWFYNRPSDVVFETDYGLFADSSVSSSMDDYSTHYVLPYDARIDEGDLDSVTLTLTGSFDREIVANEFKGDFLKLQDVSDSNRVYYSEIQGNTAADVGEQFIIYSLNELPFSPAANDLAQVIKRRPEGINYFSVLTRDTGIGSWIYREVSGSAFIPSQEQTYDWYAHNVIKDGLPADISTDDNQARVNLLLTEANRQRAMSNVAWNDATELAPEALRRLGNQFGIEVDENLPLRDQRRLVPLWHAKVNQVGASLDGIVNLSNLVFGSGSFISGTLADPSSDSIAGKVLSINVSAYEDYGFVWDDSSNEIGYDSTRKQWFINATATQISADLQLLTHAHVINLNGSHLSDPILIANHRFDPDTGGIRLYFDTRQVADLPVLDSVSKIVILDEPKQRRLFAFIKYLKQIIPDWIRIKYT